MKQENLDYINTLKISSPYLNVQDLRNILRGANWNEELIVEGIL